MRFRAYMPRSRYCSRLSLCADMSPGRLMRYHAIYRHRADRLFFFFFFCLMPLFFFFFFFFFFFIFAAFSLLFFFFFFAAVYIIMRAAYRTQDTQDATVVVTARYR